MSTTKYVTLNLCATNTTKHVCLYEHSYMCNTKTMCLYKHRYVCNTKPTGHDSIIPALLVLLPACLCERRYVRNTKPMCLYDTAMCVNPTLTPTPTTTHNP